VPLIMAGPGVPEGRRITANCSLVDILPTLVDLAMTDDWEGYPEPPDGESLLPLLKEDSDSRIAVSELMSEGVAAPYVLLRKGKYKLTYVDHDPPQLFDMEADRDELHDLATSPAHADVLKDMLAEVARRWDMPRLKKEIITSQRRRRLVYKALTTGKITPWDYQPWQDASLQYYRGTRSYHEAEARDVLRD
jgi:choline-sulfatase